MGTMAFTIATAKTPSIAAINANVSEIKTLRDYRWRKEYGGLKLEQARRLKELEKENSRLRRLVTELSLEKQVLKDVAEGNF